MMRKLAVTVFAMSLTLVGCGSSSTSKKDSGADAQTTADVGAKMDVVAITDTLPPTTDVVVLMDAKPADSATDVSGTPDMAPKTDVSGDVTPSKTDARDGSVSTDSRPSDAVVVVRLDAMGDTTSTTTDAPADTTPVSGDAGLEVGDDAETD